MYIILVESQKTFVSVSSKYEITCHLTNTLVFMLIYRLKYQDNDRKYI